MRGTIPRHAETLEALLAAEDPDESEMLAKALCRAPRNRAQMRDRIKGMGRRVRLEAGFGLTHRRSLVMEIHEPWVKA